MIADKMLKELYVKRKFSMQQIAMKLGCSVNQVSYWMDKYGIQRRTIAEGVYVKCNPRGDPFTVSYPKTIAEGVLYGIGVGLYWGEGTRANKSSIRLGNTDPRLIKKFIEFLGGVYSIEPKKLKFGLQIFSTMSPAQALKFWCQSLRVSPKQFSKIVVTPARGRGTYGRKIKHGVLTVYYHNRKLRDILCSEIEKV